MATQMPVCAAFVLSRVLVLAALMLAATSATAGLVPGGGPTSSDCYLQLDVEGIQNGTDRVKQNTTVLCTDGEACDNGPCGDNVCTMTVRACVNQPAAGCTPPTGLVSASINGKLSVQVPQLLQGPQCSAPVMGTVPATLNKKGKYIKRKSQLKLNGKAKGPKGTKPRSDSDGWILQCLPRTVDCPPPTTTTSTPATTSTSTTATFPPGCVATSGQFCDLGDGTVFDQITGQQWEKKDGADGVPNPANIHDVDNRYTWAGCCNGDCSITANLCQPNAAAAATCAAQASGGTQGCSVCASGTCDVDPFGDGVITTVWDWINQVNAANFAGHNNWRVPSEAACNSCYSRRGRPEGGDLGSISQVIPSPYGECAACNPHDLEMILLAPRLCETSPCINSIFGSTGRGLYWTSTTATATGEPRIVWLVDFDAGGVLLGDKSLGQYVRAVRSGP